MIKFSQQYDLNGRLNFLIVWNSMKMDDFYFAVNLKVQFNRRQYRKINRNALK